MFHVKVWLGVILAGIITLQLWWMHPALKSKVDEERERLRPLLYGQRFEHALNNYYQKLLKKIKKLANSKKLRKIVSSLNYDAEEDLSLAMSYSEVHDKLKSKWGIHRKLRNKNEIYYIITRDGYIIYRSNKPQIYTHDSDKLKHDIPHVTDAIQGRSRTGIWNIEGKTSIVAAAPIYHFKKKKVMAALLYGRKFDSKIFHPIQKEIPKGTKVILFTAHYQKGAEEPTLSPLAYNITDPKLIGLFRGWFKKKGYDVILDKFERGMDRDRLSATINEVDYNYMVGLFPADLGPPNVGYVLLVPKPKDFFKIDRKNYYMSGGPLIFSLICFIFVVLLGTWLSGAEIYYFRRVLPPLQTAPQEGFPNIPEHGLHGPWRKLVESINRIFTMIRERGLGNQDMTPKTSLIQEESHIDAVNLLAGDLSGETEQPLEIQPTTDPNQIFQTPQQYTDNQHNYQQGYPAPSNQPQGTLYPNQPAQYPQGYYEDPNKKK